jgi:hypothetical protein
MFESILSLAFVIVLLGYFYRKTQVNNYKRIVEMTDSQPDDYVQFNGEAAHVGNLDPLK